MNTIVCVCVCVLWGWGYKLFYRGKGKRPLQNVSGEIGGVCGGRGAHRLFCNSYETVLPSPLPLTFLKQRCVENIAKYAQRSNSKHQHSDYLPRMSGCRIIAGSKRGIRCNTEVDL